MNSQNDRQPVVSLPERFRLSWESGEPAPDVLLFLAAHAQASSRDRLKIIQIDREYRSVRGQELSISDYLAVAPDLAGQPEFLAAFTSERSPDACSGNAPGPPEKNRPSTGREAGGAAIASTVDSPATQADTGAGQTTLVPATEPLPKTLPAGGALLSTADAAQLAAEDTVSFNLSEGIRPESTEDAASAPDSAARFTILERLGAGGMGMVYRAFDRERRETVALKTMRRVDPLALYRFKNEFRTLADLTHPNLVNLFELIAVGDLWFFTMEVIDGIDFIHFIHFVEEEARPGSVTPAMIDRLRGALRQLAEGLHALHKAGKLHRDVKPTNVLVTAEGRVVLLDFGLAADLQRSSSLVNTDGQIIGTVSYMSPEQAEGLPASTASDWYSVGVMLFQALTGRLPHEGTTAEILRKKTSLDPPALGDLVPGVPEGLSRLCMDLLNRDPELRPTGQEVLARLESAPLNREVWPAPHLPTRLIGRVAHLDFLRRTLAGVRSGEPLVLFISGRSGSGKSTLVQSFLDETSTAGDVVILTGRCYERESVPYKALDSLLDALSSHLNQLPEGKVLELLADDTPLLARLFPVLQNVDAIARSHPPAVESPDQFEIRRRASAALRHLLTRMARDRTLILAIDDLHWGDIDSAMLLQDLMRPPQPPPLLFLGSYRSEEAGRSPFLRAVESLGDGGLATSRRWELAVEPLTLAESSELALEILGRDDATARMRAHAIATESKGNPLFIHELVNYVQGGEALAGSWDRTGQINLDAVLWSRINRLPERSRRLLETIAVSGQPVVQAIAIAASEIGPEGRAAVLELRGARLIRISGPSPRDEMEVFHDQIRETIVGHLSPTVLQQRHHSLARALEATEHADLEQLAIHLEGAGDLDRASSYYARAADQADRALAFDHAAKLYRKAIELGPSPDAEQTAHLWSRLGDALANAGRGREAAQAYLAAAPGASAAGTLELQRRATMQLLISGHVDEGLEALRKVLEPMRMSLPATPLRALVSLLTRRLILRLRGLGFVPRDASQISAEDLTRIDLCWSAVAGLSIIDPIMGADFQARGLLRALRAGEPYRIARALAMEAAHVSTAGGPARRRYERLLAMAEPLAQRVGQPHARAMTTLARALGLLMLGEWKTACTSFDLAESLLRDQCTGVAWELDTVHNLCLWGLVHMGDLNAVRRRWPALIKESRDRGDLYAETTLNTYYMTILKLAEGDDREPEHELDRVMQCWTQRGFHIQHSTAFRARCHMLLYRGDVAGAWNLVKSVWPLYKGSLLLRVQMIRIQMHELRGRCATAMAARSEDRRSLLAQAEHDAVCLERQERPWALAYARFLQAAIASQRGQRDDARQRLEDAANRFEACDMRLCAAVMQWHLGALIGGSQGSSLRARATALMSEQGIQDPARWAIMYAPGFTTVET